MFCTTECWDCEDKNCRNYISKSELYFENQKLKDELKEIEETESLQFEQTEFWINKYHEIKQVLDEIREYIENNSLYEEEYDYDYEETMYLSGISDEKAKEDLLQILDKVKENERGTTKAS